MLPPLVAWAGPLVLFMQIPPIPRAWLLNLPLSQGQCMLSPGAGRQGLGCPPRPEVPRLAPHPPWNLQEGVDSFQRGPQCWGLACMACPGSWVSWPPLSSSCQH